MSESYEINESLNELIFYSLSEVEYYRNRSVFFKTKERNLDLCSLGKLPLLDFESIYNNYSGFIADPYHKFPKNQNVLIQRAFECGGNMFKMIWDRDDYVKINESLAKRRKKLYGIQPEDRYCSFYTTLYQANMIVEEKGTQVINDGKNMIFNAFCLNDDKLGIILREMVDFDPCWLLLQPSIASILVKYIKKHGIEKPKNIRYIELYGEMVDETNRKLIEDTFGVTIAAYTYSTSTVGVAAIECPCKRMHVISENAIIEVIKNGSPVVGEVGDICVTGLRNHAMPIIRYLTGEKGILITEECLCGNRAPIIQITKGKNYPHIYLKDGGELSLYSLQGAIEFTNEYMENAIKTMSVIQKEEDVFEAKIELKPAFLGWKEAVVEAFKSNICEDSIRQAKWRFVFSDGVVLEYI